MSLKDFSNQLKNWKKQVFGDIVRGKARIQNRLEGVQRKLEENASTALIKLEKIELDVE